MPLSGSLPSCFFCLECFFLWSLIMTFLNFWKHLFDSIPKKEDPLGGSIRLDIGSHTPYFSGGLHSTSWLDMSCLPPWPPGCKAGARQSGMRSFWGSMVFSVFGPQDIQLVLPGGFDGCVDSAALNLLHEHWAFWWCSCRQILCRPWHFLPSPL